MTKRTYDDTLERDLVDYLQAGFSEEEQIQFDTIASTLEQIITMSSNTRFREKCMRLLLGDEPGRSALKDAILMRLYQQALKKRDGGRNN